jgi:hypothetical protein
MNDTAQISPHRKQTRQQLYALDKICDNTTLDGPHQALDDNHAENETHIDVPKHCAP